MNMVSIFRKNGWDLNLDDALVNSLLKKANENGDRCPCDIQNTGRVCPCTDYLENDICHCNLYVKRNTLPRNTNLPPLPDDVNLKEQMDIMRSIIKTADDIKASIPVQVKRED